MGKYSKWYINNPLYIFMFTKVVNKVVKISADAVHAGLGINTGRSSEIFMTETCQFCYDDSALLVICVINWTHGAHHVRRVNIQKKISHKITDNAWTCKPSKADYC